MEKNVCCLALAIALVSSTSAHAAAFSALITDQAGNAVANAVVALLPDQRAAMPAPDSRLAADKAVDQKGEKFIPIVTIVPRGGRIKFSNNDGTMHQVYSFSAIKQFEFSLTNGQTTPAVVFDKSGVAAIGCNIHDGMIAFAFVAESPWTVLTDEHGKAQLEGLPEGSYAAQVWHHRMPPGSPRPSERLSVGNAPVTLTMRVRLTPEPAASRRHGGSY